MSDQLKTAVPSTTPKQIESEWTRDAKLAFRNLKWAFTDASTLNHFDPATPVILQTNASRFTRAGILNEYDSFGILCQVNIYSRKSTCDGQNYATYDREISAIVETTIQWRHYREGANHMVLIQCNHNNLEYVQMSEVLSRQQGRWAEIIPSYHFVIQQVEGKKCPADRPSERPDYMIGYKSIMAKLLATLAATTITESHDDHPPEINAAQETDLVAMEIRATLVDGSTADESGWRAIERCLTYEEKEYVHAAFHSRETSVVRHHPESGHFGALNTANLVSGDVHWPAMLSEIWKYVAGCEFCHPIKAPYHIC